MFKLKDEFIEQYAGREPEWGFASGPNSIGEITFFRTYSRKKPDGTKERWHETVRRVVEGCYTLQRDHAKSFHLPWSDDKAQRSAQEMYDRIFTFKFLPPGRGLWMMGTDYLFERQNSACLFNCAFVSTLEPSDPSKPFAYLMDMSMLGVGVGFDTKGAGQQVYMPTLPPVKHVVADSREGWVRSVRTLLDSYLLPDQPLIEFDYSEVRPRGAPINGFGGTAEGPDPLIKLHNRIKRVMLARDGGKLTSRDITDVMNMIGACVVAGNVRRSAEIALGEPDDDEFLDLKDYSKHPERAEWAWASNNSVLAEVGMDYDAIVRRIADNGEPGLVYLDVARNYGRTGDEPRTDDYRVAGVNPCGEIMLESYELCNLVEVFPSKHQSKEDFMRTLKFAYLYAKSVTLMPTNWQETNAVMLRNRRIGTSLSGVVEFISTNGEDALNDLMHSGYDYLGRLDRQYSEWLCIRESIRMTTVKPSGTVSLLVGTTPGAHYPTFDTYIRRIRFAEGHPLLAKLVEAGYHTEPDLSSDHTTVVEIPVRGKGLPTEQDVSMQQKAHVAAFMSQNWSDNSTSVTVTFKPEESDQIADVLRANEGKWKTVSFLPMTEGGAYPQMPYEAISESEYERRSHGLKKLDFSEFYGTEAEGEKYCTTSHCELKL